MGSFAPSPTDSPTLNIKNCIALQVYLVKKNSLKQLINGPAAVSLIGDPSISDVILQPSQGEFILANSAYLLRNPYFASRLGTAGLESSSFSTLKVHPPFPSDFRLLLNAIYANTQEYCESRIVASNCIPLLMNALEFKADTVVAACLLWFSKNWTTAIKDYSFSSTCIDRETLSTLLSTLKSNKDKLHVILVWARDWPECTQLSTSNDPNALCKFVESNVDFEQVSPNAWMELSDAFRESVAVCVSPQVHNLLFKKLMEKVKNVEGVQVQCEKCREWVSANVLWDDKVTCSVRKGAHYLTARGVYHPSAASDMHEQSAVKNMDSSVGGPGKKDAGIAKRVLGWCVVGILVGGIMLFFLLLL
ncbi:UNVERIFIED_CONTAM: hypothetical protein HDU68_003500 [Siphonaria sp. JEL0065]|nr:hypothetical protein HDU68_003500 [Siphonaria sp. JEL0065]